MSQNFGIKIPVYPHIYIKGLHGGYLKIQTIFLDSSQLILSQTLIQVLFAFSFRTDEQHQLFWPLLLFLAIHILGCKTFQPEDSTADFSTMIHFRKI